MPSHICILDEACSERVLISGDREGIHKRNKRAVFRIHFGSSCPGAVLYVALSAMAVSKLGAATRAFVRVLLVLARSYKLLLEVNRDSPEEQLVKAYKKLLLKHTPRQRRQNQGPGAAELSQRGLGPGAWTSECVASGRKTCRRTQGVPGQCCSGALNLPRRG